MELDSLEDDLDAAEFPGDVDDEGGDDEPRDEGEGDHGEGQSKADEDEGDADGDADGDAAETVTRKQTGYVFFSNTNRNAVKEEIAADEECKDLGNKEKNQKVVARLAARWQGLTEAEKEAHKNAAPLVVVKKRRQKRKKEGDDAANEEDLVETFQAKQSGYMYFSNEKREEVRKAIDDEGEDVAKGDKNKLVMKRLGDLWGHVSVADKKDWGERAPMVVRKRKKNKPAVAASPVVAAKPASLTKEQIDLLRELKKLVDEGVLDATEFRDQKAMILKGATDDDADGRARSGSGGGAAPWRDGESDAPASKKKAKRESGEGATSAKKPRKPKEPKEAKEVAARLQLPVVALDQFINEAVELQASNPKRFETASHTRYEGYKGGTTMRECLGLGARKTDLTQDFIKGYMVLAREDQQAELQSFCEPEATRKSRGGAPAGGAARPPKRVVALEQLDGCYLIARVVEGKEAPAPPTSYRRATGALLLRGLGEGVGAVTMKGVKSPATGALFEPALEAPKSRTTDTGAFRFKLDVNKAALGEQGSCVGELLLQCSEERDEGGFYVLDGTFKFDANCPEFSSQMSWVEKIRAFHVDDEPEGWPFRDAAEEEEA